MNEPAHPRISGNPDADTALSGPELEQELRSALEQGQLELHYQPQMDLEHGRLMGFEALLRWRHPVKGMISPAEFVPVAEASGLIHAVGIRALKTACAQNKAWQDAGLPPVRVAVNVSSLQFHQRQVADTIAEVLRETRLEAKYLEIEVTESVITHDIEATIAELGRIQALGVHIAIDDFGTGYSSLNYLKRFPIHAIKIDQSFVRDIIFDPDDASIVKAIIAMAHNLRLHVLAEGVETEGQLGFLVRHRCDTIQGWLFSAALPPDQAERLLRENRRLDLTAARQLAHQRTLLIVDDEANIRSALVRLLRRDEYRILSAAGGKEGLELLALNDVGVIVSDQRMPEMTGVEFLKRVKSLYPKAMRLVLSGYTDLNTVTEAINEGAIYKFLTKPWDDDLLRANIREAFERYEVVLENERLRHEIDRVNHELEAHNAELEQCVHEKTREILYSLNRVQISQEILENLPIGVVGVDESGLIVMVNRKADQLFGIDRHGTLLGCDVDNRLPSVMAHAVETGDYANAGQQVIGLEDGRRITVWYRQMGEHSSSQRLVIVIAENESA